MTSKGVVRQYNCVVKSDEKSAMIASRKVNPNALRTNNGKGDIYYTSLASKFVTLMSVKFATLDNEGIGMEMESDKPGWYDALNGLPGLFGSSTPEVFELRKMMKFFGNLLKENKDEQIFVPVEVAKLFNGLYDLLKQKLSSFDFWDKATTLKEEYRKSVIFGIEGKEEQVSIDSIIDFIDKAISKINVGLKKAIDPKTNLYFTYFRYEATEFENKPSNLKFSVIE